MTPERFEVAPDIAWVDAGTVGMDRAELYVARLPDGPPLLLTDAAWAIWLAVAETGTLDEIVERAAELTDSDPAHVAALVRDFVEQLVADGLAVRHPSTPSTAATGRNPASET